MSETKFRDSAGGRLLVVDRITGGIAVIEDGDRHFEVSVSEIKGYVREGDVLTVDGGVIAVDKDATKRRRREILKLQNSLWDG